MLLYRHHNITDKKREILADAAEVEDDWAEEPFHPAWTDDACEVAAEEERHNAVAVPAPEEGG